MLITAHGRVAKPGAFMDLQPVRSLHSDSIRMSVNDRELIMAYSV